MLFRGLMFGYSVYDHLVTFRSFEILPVCNQQEDDAAMMIPTVPSNLPMPLFDIKTLGIRNGKLPRRAVGPVLEWTMEHRQELLEDWNLADQHHPLRSIKPLE